MLEIEYRIANVQQNVADKVKAVTPFAVVKVTGDWLDTADATEQSRGSFADCGDK